MIFPSISLPIAKLMVAFEREDDDNKAGELDSSENRM
jgi:hypothetical protein